MVCEDTNHGCVSYSIVIMTRPKTPLKKPLQQGLYIFITFRGTA